MLDHVSSGDEDAILEETQILQIVHALLLVCQRLHKESLTMMNLHPANVFIPLNAIGDLSNDLLVTDAGLAYFPRYSLRDGVSDTFTAPELSKRDSGKLLEEVADETPGRADIYSIGRIALLLAVGDPDAGSEELSDNFSPEFVDFIERALKEEPPHRYTAETLLK